MKEIELISIKTKNLKKNQLTSICKLKNSFWSWTISKQLSWFKKNIKAEDINNLLFFKNKLIGYTCLRKRKFCQRKKEFFYHYFDAFLIKKQKRHLGFGKILMNFNIKILDNLKSRSFLLCQRKNIEYYKKYKWRFLPKSKFNLLDHNPAWFKKKNQICAMIYGKWNIKKKLYLYLNK